MVNCVEGLLEISFLSWSFYSSRESMDELIVNSDEQKVQDCLSSTNFYLNISTASVMNEKVRQINQ